MTPNSRAHRTVGLRRRHLLAFAIVAVATTAPFAVAALTPLPVASVTAGGATWLGIDPLQASCSPTTTTLNIVDAQLDGPSPLGDTYDGGLCMMVADTGFAGPTSVDLTGSTLTSGPIGMSGLDVTYQYAFLNTRPAVRALASFANPSTTAITVPVTFATNLGSDDRTITGASSSGDAFLDATDRWAMTGGDVDPTVVHVVAGPGNAPVVPSASGLGRKGAGCTVTTTFLDEMCTTFSVTVPAGATRRLMVVDELAVDPAAALPVAESYDARGTILNELTADLSPAAKAQIVNWDFSAIPVPPPAPVDTVAPVLAAPVLTSRVARRGVARVLQFSLSESAAVTMTIAQLLPGRRAGTACRTTLTSGPRCTKVVARGSLTRTQQPGASVHVSVPATIGGRTLAVGKYRLTVTATDAAGNVSSPTVIGFTVTK